MKSFNILIIEDDWLNSQYIKKTVEALGHTIIAQVANANDALKIAQTSEISLVFMDINIEGATDGIECAKLLNENMQIPIVYLTAYSDSQTLDETSITNMYGFVAKPYTAKDIEIVLNTAKARITQEKMAVVLDNNLVDLDHNYIYNKTLKTLRIDDKLVYLTKKESQFLHLVVININNSVSVEAINSELWKYEVTENSTLRNLVSRLRKKMPLVEIENLYGIGYILNK